MLATPHDTRISWFRLFDDLKREGWSLHRIGRELSVPKGTLLAWRAGVEPRHFDGERLICFWELVTGKERDVLPTEPRYPSAHKRRMA